MTWAAVAAAGATVVSSVVQSKSAKKAGKKASKGAQAELDLIRESRDIVRSDTRQTRQAGATALNALMSMTGLAGGGGGGAQYTAEGWPVENPGGATAMSPPIPDDTVAPQTRTSSYADQFDSFEDPRYSPRDDFFGGPRIMAAARGAHMGQQQLYNINEEGPENVYSQGFMKRSPNPMTIDGQTGFVQPNKPQGYAPPQMVPPSAPPGAAISQANMFRGRIANQPMGRGSRVNRRGAMQQGLAIGQGFQGGVAGRPEPRIQGRGIGGFLSGGGLMGALIPEGGGGGKEQGMGPAYGSGKRGELPGTDWITNNKGKIITTGQGHWNEGMGKYVDRRGRVLGQQAAAPEGSSLYDDPTATDIDTTQGQDYNFQTDPGYQFRFEEGQRSLDRSAAASGGLLSGGYGRKLTRYGQGFASNEYTNVYNRIANIAGMGQVANQFAGNATMMGGAGMGNAAANAGYASAYGTQMQGNAMAQGVQQLGQVDWAGVFNRGGSNEVVGVADPRYNATTGTLSGPPRY